MYQKLTYDQETCKTSAIGIRFLRLHVLSKLVLSFTIKVYMPFTETHFCNVNLTDGVTYLALER